MVIFFKLCCCLFNFLYINFKRIIDSKQFVKNAELVSYSLLFCPRAFQNEPPYDKTNKMACVPSEESAQSDQSLCCPHEESLGP